MTGGSTNNSTKFGANRTVGKPGMRASATPATTSKIEDGNSKRAASQAIAAITANNRIRSSMVGSIEDCAGLGLIALQAHQLPATAFVRSAFRPRPGHLRETLLFAQLRPPLDTRRGFHKMRLSLARGPPANGQTQYLEFTHNALQRQAQAITDTHPVRRLDALAVQVNLTAVDRSSCRAPRFVKSGVPQPLVQSRMLILVLACHKYNPFSSAKGARPPL